MKLFVRADSGAFNDPIDLKSTDLLQSIVMMLVFSKLTSV